MKWEGMGKAKDIKGKRKVMEREGEFEGRVGMG